MPAGTISVAQEDIVIAPLLDAAIGEALARSARGVRVQLSVEPPSLSAGGDPGRIHQLVTSLLEDAILVSPGGGRVAVGAFAPDDGTVELSVMDEGPDIRTEGADGVFDCFGRAPSARAWDGQTAHGLAIVRSIVDLHGASIRAEPRQPRGCRMVVALPRARA